MHVSRHNILPGTAMGRRRKTSYPTRPARDRLVQADPMAMQSDNSYMLPRPRSLHPTYIP